MFLLFFPPNYDLEMAGQGGLSDRDRLAFSPYLNIDSGALSNVQYLI